MIADWFEGFGSVYLKELGDFARERRVASLLTLLGFAVALPFVFLEGPLVNAGNGYASADLGLMFLLLVFLILASLTFVTDGVSKEQDSGMSALLFSSPIGSAGLVIAKAAISLTLYAALALVTFTFAWLMSPAFGAVAWIVVGWALLVPLLAFWLFLTGFLLFVSSWTRSSKTAIAIGIAFVLPMFLASNRFGLGPVVASLSPTLSLLVSVDPVNVAFQAMLNLLTGVPLDPAPLAGIAVVGFLLVAATCAAVSRWEVAG
ncbi:MAG: ABC transporter permease [Thermoplasmatota archaeon]